MWNVQFIWRVDVPAFLVFPMQSLLSSALCTPDAGLSQHWMPDMWSRGEAGLPRSYHTVGCLRNRSWAGPPHRGSGGQAGTQDTGGREVQSCGGPLKPVERRGHAYDTAASLVTGSVGALCLADVSLWTREFQREFPSHVFTSWQIVQPNACLERRMIENSPRTQIELPRKAFIQTSFPCIVSAGLRSGMIQITWNPTGEWTAQQWWYPEASESGIQGVTLEIVQWPRFPE